MYREERKTENSFLRERKKETAFSASVTNMAYQLQRLDSIVSTNSSTSKSSIEIRDDFVGELTRLTKSKDSLNNNLENVSVIHSRLVKL